MNSSSEYGFVALAYFQLLLMCYLGNEVKEIVSPTRFNVQLLKNQLQYLYTRTSGHKRRNFRFKARGERKKSIRDIENYFFFKVVFLTNTEFSFRALLDIAFIQHVFFYFESFKFEFLNLP